MSRRIRLSTTRWMHLLGVLVVLGLTTSPSQLHAEIYLVDGENFQFTLGGYVQNLSGYQRSPVETGQSELDALGLNSSIVRFEWGMNFWEFATLLVHNRFYWQVASTDMLTAGGVFGLGVTTPPESHINMRSVLLEDPDGRYLLVHDVDRLVLSFYTEIADIYVGRQAISWGNAMLFPVSDLWAQFSPYELDTSQKPGVDAVRAIAPVGERTELDFIFADKGEVEDLSGGLRASFYLESSDVYTAFAKIWNELFLFGGMSWDLEKVSLRFDVAFPFDIDETELLLPRATVGLEYFGSDLFLSVAAHFNGLGAANADGYIDEFQSESMSRGETYFVGRYYLGGIFTYKVTELFTVGLSSILNLRDPSVFFLPTMSYQVSQNVDVTLGSYLTFGADPVIADPVEINSEYGTYPLLVYLQIAAYF